MTDSEVIKEEYIRLQKYEFDELYPRERQVQLLNQVADALKKFHTLKAGKALDKVMESILWLNNDLDDLRKGFRICKENIL